ncbi:nucleolar and coiled-body phosphoprotein 1 [Xylographa opegraphella]|nr:nucleolar and coiled-body phosphoprotein 1 [Xylographa opegraphella]
MNPFSNLFMAAKPSGTYQVPSASSSEGEEWDLHDVILQPLVGEDMVDTTSEDEEGDSDQDFPMDYAEEYIEDLSGEGEAFVDVKKTSLMITPIKPAKIAYPTPKSLPRVREHRSRSQAVARVESETDHDDLQGSPDEDASFIPVKQLNVNLTPKTPVEMVLKPVETEAQRESESSSPESIDMTAINPVKNWGEKHVISSDRLTIKIIPKKSTRKLLGPGKTTARQENKPPKLTNVTSSGSHYDEEFKGNPDHTDSFSPIEQSKVKTTPDKPPKKVLNPRKTISKRKDKPPIVDDVTTSGSDSDEDVKGKPDYTDSFTPAGKPKVKLTLNKPTKKVGKPQETKAKQKYNAPIVNDATSGSDDEDEFEGKPKHTDSFIFDSQSTKTTTPKKTAKRPGRPKKLRTRQNDSDSSGIKPAPGPVGRPRAREPTTESSQTSPQNASSGLPGTAGTPPLEEALFARRLTRSMTRRIRKNNLRYGESTPRREGLTALTYEGRSELPSFQDARGGPDKRFIHLNPKSPRFKGQGIRKAKSGTNQGLERRKQWMRVS